MNATADRPQKPRRRFLKFSILGLLLLAAALFAAPWVISPMVPGFVKKRLEGDLNARADLESFRFRWPGTIAARGFALEDLGGERVASVDRLDVSVDLVGAMRRKMAADVVIDGVRIDLRKTADGRWNVETLTRPSATPKPDEDEAAPEIPDARVRFELRNARVVIHGEGGSTEIHDVGMTVDMPGGGQPAAIEFGLALRGPGGEAGTVGMTANMGVRGADLGKGELELRLEGLLLDAFEPLLVPLAPELKGLAGRIDGALAFEMAGPESIAGGGEIVLADLRVPATREGAPAFAPGEARVKIDMSPDGAATAQDVEVALGDLVQLSYQGRMEPAEDSARRVAGVLRIDGSVDRLVAAARSFVPIERGLKVSGSLGGDARFDATLGDEGPERMSVTADWQVANLLARDSQGAPIDLAGIRALSLALEGEMTGDVFSMPRVKADLGPVQIDGHARMTGLEGGEAPRMDDSSFQVDVDLERARRLLDALLEEPPPDLAGRLRAVAQAAQDGDDMAVTLKIEPQGLRVQDIGILGAPIEGVLRMTPGEGGAMRMKGDLATLRLDVVLADGKRIAQRDIAIQLDVDRAADAVAVKRLAASSSTASLLVTGEMKGSDPTSATGDFRIDVDAEAERVLADLGAALGLDGYRGRGTIDAGFDVRMRPEEMALEGALVAKQLDVTVPAAEEGAQPLRIQEPEVRLDLRSRMKQAEQRMLLERFELRSDTLWGEMTADIEGVAMGGGEPAGEMFVESMKGTFHYVPDRLGAFLNPHLPGRLSGTEPEELKIDFRGPASEMDLYGLLAEASMEMGVGLGTFTAAGVDTSGRIEVKVEDGRLRVVGDLGASGGSLDLEMQLGASKAAPESARKDASLSLELEAVKVKGGIQELLGAIHPVFAPLGDLGVTDTVDALLSARLDLRYKGPLSLEELVRDFDRLPRDFFYGKGEIRLDDAVIRSSPLLGDLVARLGLGGGAQKVSLAPIGFEIDSSRLSYADAWVWEIAGVKTSFSGGVGLDGLLDLVWSVPVDRKLVKRYPFLERLEGRSLEIPLTGSAKAPRLEWDRAIQSLAGEVARKETEDATSKLAEEAGLGALLGSDDPAALLAEADRLWASGDKKAARKVYRRIRDGFKISTVYLLNKDRIEKRADWKPDEAKSGKDEKDDDKKEKKDKGKKDKDKGAKSGGNTGGGPGEEFAGSDADGSDVAEVDATEDAGPGEDEQSGDGEKKKKQQKKKKKKDKKGSGDEDGWITGRPPR